MSTDTTAKIRQLNDQFRKAPAFFAAAYGRVMITSGIAALDPTDQIAIMDKVRSFETFSEANDPHGEHDFGSFDHSGLKVFWKIDTYDRTLTWGSEDPSDPAKTCRVLTVMLAEEY